MVRPPSWKALGTLLVGGAGVQLRAVAQNITFLAVMRAILTMDETGTAAAAHTDFFASFPARCDCHFGVEYDCDDFNSATHELDG